jgi:hypothetical protein
MSDTNYTPATSRDYDTLQTLSEVDKEIEWHLAQDIDLLGVMRQDVTQALVRPALEKLGITPPTIEVAPAKHGRGLFARSEIRIGQFITLYPSDLTYELSPGQRAHSLVRISSRLNRIVKESPSPTEWIQNWINERVDYAYMFPDGRTGVGATEFDNEQWFLAHFANDAVTCTKETQNIYNAVADEATNSKFYSFGNGPVGGPCYAALFASKDIAPNEEILVSYGSKYWIAKSSNARKS